MRSAGAGACAAGSRADWRSSGAIWQRLYPGQIGAAALDEQLQAERVDPESRGQRRHPMAFGDLPDGTFVLLDDRPWLVLGDALLEWTPAGYVAERRARPRSGPALVLTPTSLVEVLRAGWDGGAVPVIHPTASGAAAVT